MKRSIVVVASIVVATGAFAQSNQVQLYGTIDQGVFKSETKKEDKSDTSSFGVGAGKQGTLTIGVKGQEDLGGGQEARFKLEMRRDDTKDSNGTDSAVKMFYHEASVGLYSNGGSSFSVGYMPTDTFKTVNVVDAAMMVGGHFNLSPYSDYTRRANLLNFTQDLGGAYVSVSAGNGQTKVHAIGDEPKYFGPARIVSASLGSKNESGLSFGASFQRETAHDATPERNGKTFDMQRDTALLDASYRISNVVPFVRVKREDTTGDYAYRTHVLQTGLNYNTPTYTAFALVLGGEQSGKDKNSKTLYGYQAGVKYHLSARTNVYGVYGYEHADGKNDSAALSNTTYGVGLKHSF